MEIGASIPGNILKVYVQEGDTVKMGQSLILVEAMKMETNSELPLVVDLWATWCGPCKMLGPIISELANDYDGKIVVNKCDVEENNKVAVVVVN